jgi:alpha-glucosidase
MLARPGFAGSGLKASPWWQRATFYQISEPANPDFKAIAIRLDALKALGVDALLLPAPELPPPGANSTMPNLDDLDNLLRQASGQGIRVLLTIRAPSPTADLTGIARFWLSRGVAGLHIASVPGASPDDAQSTIQKLRKLESTVAGQRILISDLDLTPPAATSPHGRPARTDAGAAQLQINTRADHLATLDAASLRPLLAQTIAQPNLLLDLHAANSAAAEPVAAIALLTEPSAIIDSSAHLVLEPTVKPVEEPDQPAAPPPPPPVAPPPGVYLPYVPYVPPPKPHPAVAAAPKLVPTDPLTKWYQQLADLRAGNAVLRTGTKILLDFDAQNTLVWVSRPTKESVTARPIVVACNLSAAPVQLSLTAAMKSLNLRGFFLRTLLRTDQAMGAQDLNSVSVPPYSVYIGELRF